MTPFEALYGRRCRTLVCWKEVGERKLYGPKLVQVVTENIKIIKKNLKTDRNRWKSYVDNCHRALEFEVEDSFPKIITMEGRNRIWKKRKTKSIIHRTLRDSRTYGTSGLQVKIVHTIV